MAADDAPDQSTHLSPSELARQRSRDRKRTTRMVVDNAGVKRILLARRARAAQRGGDPGATAVAGQVEGQRTT